MRLTLTTSSKLTEGAASNMLPNASLYGLGRTAVYESSTVSSPVESCLSKPPRLTWIAMDCAILIYSPPLVTHRSWILLATRSWRASMESEFSGLKLSLNSAAMTSLYVHISSWFPLDPCPQRSALLQIHDLSQLLTQRFPSLLSSRAPLRSSSDPMHTVLHPLQARRLSCGSACGPWARESLLLNTIEERSGELSRDCGASGAAAGHGA